MGPKLKLKLSDGASSIAKRSAKQGHVLIVDDEQANLDGLEAVLSRVYHVYQTCDPNEALRIAEEHKIDLIITDQRMPQMLGTELLQALSERDPSQVRILLTGYTDIEDLITCVNDGLLYRYLVKPWKAEELLATVAQGFDKLRTERALTEHMEQIKVEVEERRRAQQRLEDALMELQEAQDALIAQEQLKALGEMVSGVAHDFNNVLTPILAFSEELLEDWSESASLDDPMQLDALQGIHDAATDGTALINRLRAAYHPTFRLNTSKQVVPLKSLVQSALKLSLPRWDRSTGELLVEVEVDETLSVCGETSELRQALVNVICNALDATRERLEETPTDAPRRVTVKAYPFGSFVNLEVIDQANGMPLGVLAQCKQAFFSTKGVAGTGLGLHMVQETVKRHHGQLQISSQEGVGTTIKMKLPSGEQCALPPREE